MAMEALICWDDTEGMAKTEEVWRGVSEACCQRDRGEAWVGYGGDGGAAGAAGATCAGVVGCDVVDRRYGMVVDVM